jgi:hypothetical protein
VLRKEFDLLRAPGVPDAPTHASLVAAAQSAHETAHAQVARDDVDTTQAIAQEV